MSAVTFASVIDLAQAARVQLLYQQVNERIHSVGSSVFGVPPDEPLSLVCECLDLGCVERIGLSAADLERARSSAGSFIVIPGHEAEGFEIVSERNPSFLVVTKDADVVARLREAGLTDLLEPE
jgi:hypothetical protein